MFSTFKQYMIATLKFAGQVVFVVFMYVVSLRIFPDQVFWLKNIYETASLRDLIIYTFILFFVAGQVENILTKDKMDKLNVRVKELEMKAENKTTDVK